MAASRTGHDFCRKSAENWKFRIKKAPFPVILTSRGRLDWQTKGIMARQSLEQRNYLNGKQFYALRPEDFAKAGGNESLIHVDFMFGTSDMCVYGIDKDGNETVFIKDGEFAV